MRDMRHFIILAASLFVFTGGLSQNSINQTRNTFNNYGKKTTKVVIPSTSLADLMLRDAVNRSWRISPFEFCDVAEYEKIKQDTNYFFLMRVDGMYKKDLEPKIEYLTLIKGGTEIKRGLYSSHNIINLPIQQSEDLDGGNLFLIPAYVNIIQDHIYRIQENVLLAFKGSLIYSDRVSKLKGKTILFSKDQLGYDISDGEFISLFKGKAKLVSASDIEEAVSNNRDKTAVAVVVIPRGGTKGSYCYKMIITTDSHELLFLRRQKISKRSPAGFSAEDIRKITVPFQF